MSKLEKILLTANIILYGFLAIFSYAYVDLNLTLSQNPQFLLFVRLMQQLGYYHRPQATLKYLKISTITNTLLLILAYPFLSSDLFNYLFDARIILNYHSNPYTHKALDF